MTFDSKTRCATAVTFGKNTRTNDDNLLDQEFVVSDYQKLNQEVLVVASGLKNGERGSTVTPLLDTIRLSPNRSFCYKMRLTYCELQ